MKIPSDHMRTLKRRADFLKSREHKNSFDLAELSALEWAIINLQPEQKRPQNCGTSYCSCIECVMEPAPVHDTEAHYKSVIEGVQKLFDDKALNAVQEKRDE